MRYVLLCLLYLLLIPFSAHAEATSRYTLMHAGLERTYSIYRPENLPAQKPVPLVIMLHGYGGTGESVRGYTKWDQMAAQRGFVVAYPDGMGKSWNSKGVCCDPARTAGIDDVGFLTQLIQSVIKTENIDPKRVYITGMSNGAAMSYRYACEGTYPIAAIGPVAGSFSQDCPQPHPVSVMAIHGMNDIAIPFEGGPGRHDPDQRPWIPVQHTLDAFISANSCLPSTKQRFDRVEQTYWQCTKGRDIELITIDRGGHDWPQDRIRAGLNATIALTDFFLRHTAP